MLLYEITIVATPLEREREVIHSIPTTMMRCALDLLADLPMSQMHSDVGIAVTK